MEIQTFKMKLQVVLTSPQAQPMTRGNQVGAREVKMQSKK